MLKWGSDWSQTDLLREDLKGVKLLKLLEIVLQQAKMAFNENWE